MRLSIRKKRRENKSIPKRKLLWNDPITGELIFFDAHWLEYTVAEDEFIETKDDKLITLEKAIEKYIDSNPGLNKIWAEYFVRNNHEIIKKRRIKAIPKFVKEIIEDNSNIYDWIEKYQNYNHTSIEIDDDNDNNVVIIFDSDEADDVIYQLERHGLNFDIME